MQWTGQSLFVAKWFHRQLSPRLKAIKSQTCLGNYLCSWGPGAYFSLYISKWDYIPCGLEAVTCDSKSLDKQSQYGGRCAKYATVSDSNLMPESLDYDSKDYSLTLSLCIHMCGRKHVCATVCLLSSWYNMLTYCTTLMRQGSNLKTINFLILQTERISWPYLFYITWSPFWSLGVTEALIGNIFTAQF